MTMSILPIVSQALVSMPRSQAQHLVNAKATHARSAEPLDAALGRLLKLVDRASRTKPTQALSEYVMAVWSRFLTWQTRRATRLLLNSLDDRTLADIGVPRDGINAVLRDIERRKANWYVSR
jgi:uncharacterized protein YjiS (DUF1127 family)